MKHISFRKIFFTLLKVIGFLTLAFIILVIAFTVISQKNYEKRAQQAKNMPTKKYTVEELIPFDIVDSDEELVVLPYEDNRSGKYGRLTIYNMDYLDKAFGNTSVSRKDIYKVIKNNTNISKRFKNLLIEYTNMVLDNYPNLDLRVFHHNLKTLKVVESDNDLMLKSVSNLSYGCYRIDENIIYVKENYDFKKQTWPYQVIMHEFGHCATFTNVTDKIRVDNADAKYNSTILNEALNSLFTIHLFDYSERDIAYQLQSNYVQVMIDCMDNYDYDDYMKYNNSYFLKQLDEFNGDNNYAWTMIRLMEVQYKDYHDDNYELEQKNFYSFYDYIADMYYRTHITNQMTKEQKRAVADELVEKITFDVPEEYKIDTEEFYRYLETYTK